MNRDNQQEIPTEGEIAWLAGIIECDGTVSLGCHTRGTQSKKKISVDLRIYNTDGGITSKVVDILTRLGLSHYVDERSQKSMKMKDGKSYGDTNKTMMSVSVKKINDAYVLGKLLHPWMSGEKKHRLSLIIQYLARRIKKMKDAGRLNVPLDEEDCRLVVEFYRRFVKRPGNKRHQVSEILNDFT